MRSHTRLDTPYSQYAPKAYLVLAIRCVLFGAASLPFMIPNQALSAAANHVMQPSIPDDEMPSVSDQPVVETNAFDGFDFDASSQQSAANTSHGINAFVNESKSAATPNTPSDQSTPNDNPISNQQIIEKLGMDNGIAKSRSLTKLAENYHAKPSREARCQGVWVQPMSQAPKSNGTHVDDTGNPLPANIIFAQADYGYYDAASFAELSGNVIIEQNGRQVIADKVTLDTLTGQAIAQGQVQFSDGHQGTDKIGTGIIGIAENLQYSTDGQTAHAQDVAFASTTINAHGYAGQLQKVSDTQYQLENVMFTTCPPTERKWYLDASNIDIDSDTGRAVVKNATLRIKEVPVFYLPYFNFPIDKRRTSGFLLPSIGFGASNSFEISSPYYLNLAANYDATLTPTIFTNRNPMLTGEFRYLTQDYGSGTLTASYLPNDRQYNGEDRSRIRFDHSWQPKKFDKINTYAQYQHVSDANYLADFDTLGLETAKLNLPRRIGASFLDENVTADFRFEGFQRLEGFDSYGKPILDKERPYARLPQLSVTYHLPKAWMNTPKGLQISGIHNSAYFKKSINDGSEPEKSGGRIFNQISASYPVLRSWGYVTPRLALSHLYTSYDEGSLADQNLSKQEGNHAIFAPTVSVDAGLFFEKSGAPFLFKDSGGYQVLTPRLHYTYTPFKNQKNVPNFETTMGQLSYEQLLSNSWFLGYDRIQDLHAITPAVSYRYIDRQGRTRFEGGVAEQIMLDDTKVGIGNSQNFSAASSGLAWQASMQPKDNVWLDASGSFTTNYHPSSFVAQLRYQPDEQKLFNFGIIERKENRAINQAPLSAYTASVIFPMNNRWRVMAQVQYDYNQNHLMDSLVGLDYEDCCYGLSIYARRYRDAFHPHLSPNTAVMAEVRLNGIANGGRLNRLLSERVLGYDQVQKAWQRAY